MSMPFLNACYPSRPRHFAASLLFAAALVWAQGTAAAGNMLRNGNFEADAAGATTVSGWELVQHAGDVSFQARIDAGTYKEGKQSLRLTRTGPEPFGKVTQFFPAQEWRGKKVRFSAWVKAEGVLPHFDHSSLGEKAGAGLTLVITESHGYLGTSDLYRDDMTDRLLRGDVEWKRYTLEATVDEKATGIEVGLVLTGKGSVWMDDAKFEEVVPEATKKSYGSSVKHKYTRDIR